MLKRRSTGQCAVCADRLWHSGKDAAKDAPSGPHPLCISETGRLAHLCDKHRRELPAQHWRPVLTLPEEDPGGTH